MAVKTRFVHTNLVARDWERLALFYEQVFGCERLSPERDLSGEWLERGTGVRHARIRGVHLRLPGYGPGGPTLEIFQYQEQIPSEPPVPNRPGFGHIAFAVEDVKAARDAVLTTGGSEIAPIVSAEIPGAGTVTFVYVADPEGNIIELQQWQE